MSRLGVGGGEMDGWRSRGWMVERRVDKWMNGWTDKYMDG